MSAAPSTAVCHGRDLCIASSQTRTTTAPSSQGTRRRASRNRSQARTGTGSRNESSGAGIPARAKRSAPAATAMMARTRARPDQPPCTTGTAAQITQPAPSRAAAPLMATERITGATRKRASGGGCSGPAAGPGN